MPGIDIFSMHGTGTVAQVRPLTIQAGVQGGKEVACHLARVLQCHNVLFIRNRRNGRLVKKAVGGEEIPNGSWVVWGAYNLPG